ncbi:DUF3667 domain-containing protein [uncultured Aquimarina sp.]|uniref:DUF3667 domain-containing protein n=1 Tax=uncultured Aquimarina sp. TaxID=575652 RepID=UPI00261BC23D|nr:DUF3667 domain-containing protein [uncultured Aquimarina sp.]
MKKSLTINNCKNCNYDLEDVNFCSNCGAKKITKRITFKNLVSEISEVYLNVDNTFIKTIRDLTIKPHIVIDGYINGVRKKHLNLASYFLLSITFSAILSFISEQFFDIQSDPKNHENTNEVIKFFLETTEKYPTLGYFLLIPFYSLISKFVFRKYKKYNFTELIVINTYFIAHLTILTFIPYIIIYSFRDYIEETSFYFLILQLAYGTFLFKNLYKLSYKKIISRGFLAMLFFVLIVAGFTLIAGIATGILKEYGLIN